MENLNLKLSVEELNTVLSALGNMPYVQVHQLIYNIQVQAGQQLKQEKRGEDSIAKIASEVALNGRN